MISIFKGKNKLAEVSIDDIVENPNQPRKAFNDDSLKELSNSIAENGLIQPITLRKGGNSKYELIAGERRLRASKMAGMTKITAIIIEANNYDSAALALIENLQRENLNYIDEADALSKLITNFGLTQDELARKVGKTQATIANKIRLLKLPEDIKAKLLEHNLTERHARAILRLEGVEMQTKVVKMIIDRHLNVSQTDSLVESIVANSDNGPKKGKCIRLFKDVRIFSNTIKQAIEMMKKSGINAVSERNEDENYIEYIVKISKAQ